MADGPGIAECMPNRTEVAMNRSLSRILLIAFVVAAGCSYLVYRVAGRQFSTRAKPQTSHIMVAARDLDIGTLLRDSDVSAGEWVGAVPKGVLASKQAAIGRG